MALVSSEVVVSSDRVVSSVVSAALEDSSVDDEDTDVELDGEDVVEEVLAAPSVPLLHAVSADAARAMPMMKVFFMGSLSFGRTCVGAVPRWVPVTLRYGSCPYR